ncbi:MAG: RHH-type proline utilization regulon transcriptional repressor/proline dehydrogenase [Halieaceae bacterium]
MLTLPDRPVSDPIRDAMAQFYRMPEDRVVEELLHRADFGADGRARVWHSAHSLVDGIRAAQVGAGGVDALLNEFALSSEEGVVLMCLAEALLRVPDKLTIDRLIRDKLLSGDWGAHLGNSDSLFVNASAWGLLLTGKVVSYREEDRVQKHSQQIGLLKKTLNRLGEPVIRTAVRYAMQVMGTQFVMGRNIGSAIDRARKQEERGYRYSYDMLGEGARTLADADRYFQSYLNAIIAIGSAAAGRGPLESPGISVKLSAIHPRYEYSHRDRVMAELVPRLKTLALAARAQDIGFTVDAEEADRLDLSLDVIEAVYSDSQLSGWEGFGLAVQAYQKRAPFVIDWAVALARRVGRKIMVRLVKGAYWDSEIKWSQIEGYSDYPVFTRKPSTDLCYQACARSLLAARDALYPQFATHNAYTVATILELDREAVGKPRQGYEFQRLHGMGEALYDQVLKAEYVACRIYAPVGEHADLLAYLVRRLLENGANTSFVNNIVDESVPVASLLEDPVVTVRGWMQRRNTAIPLPPDLFMGASGESGTRRNAVGVELTDPLELEVIAREMQAWWSSQLRSLPEGASAVEAVTNPAVRNEFLGALVIDDSHSMEQKLERVHAAWPGWNAMSVVARAALLRKLADSLEDHRYELMGLCVKEAGKTLLDAVAELREAVDFCRYYADLAQSQGELPGRGVVFCVSPWNFPLAIFLGQISAALVAGNTVVAKPAEQTTLIAQRVMALISECGFPEGVIELVQGPGRPVGEVMLPDPRIRAVMFTGSTATGQLMARVLADRDELDIPLVAETGGQNAMIVDSTALPEQVVDDVVRSGFHSAGQRCSALRVLFLQEDIADQVCTMIAGAMAELTIGDPANLATDVGPVIDAAALARLEEHVDYLDRVGEARLLYRCELSECCAKGTFFAPHLFEINDISLLRGEVFGPVVHVVKYKAYELDRIVDQINSAGFGLTLGVHSRIQTIAARIASRARVGNVYINRNMIGAVVGVQPFGGRGLSGTGPKAGGPRYLSRLLGSSSGSEHSPTAVPPEPLGSDMPPAEALTGAALAQLQWSSTLIPDRIAFVRRFCADLAAEIGGSVDPELSAMAEVLIACASDVLDRELSLPGPTGESNILLLEPRGLVSVVVDGLSTEAGELAKILAALLAGNGVLALVEPDREAAFRDYSGRCERAGLPPHVLTVVASASAKVVLSDERQTAVLVDPSSARAKPIQQLLAQRQSGIVPLLTELAGADLLERLVVEKTVSIDTTAAGGNASLMTLAEA